MDLTNTSHLLQALVVATCVFALLMGYRAGDKL